MLDAHTNWKLATVVVGCASGALIAKILWSKCRGNDQNKNRIPQKWVRVGEVSKVTIYPVKSCQGIEVNQVQATILGFQVSDICRDRIFMVGTSKGQYRTGRRLPKLTLIDVAINGNDMTLSSQGVTPITITIPKKTDHNVQSIKIFEDTVKETLDCGDEVGEWLSEFLGEKNLRLFYHVGEVTQRDLQRDEQRFPDFIPIDKGTFQDNTSFMMLPEESLTELNRHLETPMTMDSFRPTLTIKGIPEPFAEDYWTFIRVGNEQGPIFKTSMPCIRCKVTTLDPYTGIFRTDGEPLKTLKKLKRSFGNETVNNLVENQPILGMHMGLYRQGQSICVGDPVYTAVL